MLGVSLYFLGDLAGARAHLQQALFRFGVDQRVHSLSILAHILWLQGFPDQAAHTGKRGIDLAYTPRERRHLPFDNAGKFRRWFDLRRGTRHAMCVEDDS
jgi:hypothetical protein